MCRLRRSTGRPTWSTGWRRLRELLLLLADDDSFLCLLIQTQHRWPCCESALVHCIVHDRLISSHQAFLYDFEGGNSEEALHIINSRRRSVSVAKQYAAFFVSYQTIYRGVPRTHTSSQTLMLLRRFPILNKLPISAIQAQGLAKMAVQVCSLPVMYLCSNQILRRFVDRCGP